jgi:hypothetical protein
LLSKDGVFFSVGSEAVTETHHITRTVYFTTTTSIVVVYRVVATGMCLPSRCPGKVFTEPLLRKPETERWSKGTMLARGVRKPARATPGISASISIFKTVKCNTKIHRYQSIIFSPFLEDNQKFWEELIAYFPLIRHGPHRKRNKYVDTHRQQDDLIIYTRSCGDFYRAVA